MGLFRSSGNLAAYGIAVTTDMLITTVLTFFVIRYAWKLPLMLCITATGVFTVDVLFWARPSNFCTGAGFFGHCGGGFFAHGDVAG